MSHTVEALHTCSKCGETSHIKVEVVDDESIPGLLAELVEGAERLERWADLQTQTLKRIAKRVHDELLD